MPNGHENTLTNTTNGSNYKTTNNIEMIKDVNKPSMFQWVRGENLGKIAKSTGKTIIDDDIEYIVFEDGTWCNTQLLGEWIVPIENAANAAFFADQSSSIQQKNEPAGPNPVFDLLNRSKKKSSKMEISITVSMPSDELIRVIDDSYENGTRLIGEYLVNSVDQNMLMKQVEAILFKKVEEVTKKRKKVNESIV